MKVKKAIRKVSHAEELLVEVAEHLAGVDAGAVRLIGEAGRRAGAAREALEQEARPKSGVKKAAVKKARVQVPRGKKRVGEG